jgi:membrane-bound serine protease (ClpP class)
MFLSIVLSIWLGSKLLTSSSLSFLVLNSTQNKDQGFIGVDNSFQNLVGKEGIAATILRPSGKVIIDEEYYDARCQSGYIEKGEKIKVLKYTASQLYVAKSEK